MDLDPQEVENKIKAAGVKGVSHRELRTALGIHNTRDWNIRLNMCLSGLINGNQVIPVYHRYYTMGVLPEVLKSRQIEIGTLGNSAKDYTEIEKMVSDMEVSLSKVRLLLGDLKKNNGC